MLCDIPRSSTASHKPLPSNSGSATSPMAEFRGALVSLDCGIDGYYQGKIAAIDPLDSSITLEKPLKDGCPLNVPSVTLTASKIQDMKVLKMPEHDNSPAYRENTTAKSSSSNMASNCLKPINGKRVTAQDILHSHSVPQMSNTKSVLPHSVAAAVEPQVGNVIAMFKHLEPSKTTGGVRVNVNDLLNLTNATSTPTFSNVNITSSSSKSAAGKPTEPTNCPFAGHKVLPERSDAVQSAFGKICGALVSIDCTDGYYQGKIAAINTSDNSITIEKPFKDGCPLNVPTVTLTAALIGNMKVLKMPDTEIASEANNSDTATSSSSSSGKEINRAKRQPNKSTNATKVSAQELLHPPQQIKAKPIRSIPAQCIPVAVLKAKKMDTVVSKLFPPESTKGVQGVRVSVNELLNAAASSSSTFSNSHSSTGSNSSQTSPISDKAKAHTFKDYGEFKHFAEQQVPMPRRLRISKRRNGNGPCGIPAMDCSNGYGRYKEKSGLNAPLDFNLMDEDFDFDANLALFDKNDISDEEYSSGEGNGSSGGASRNYRHDENVLSDPARVTSWVVDCGAPSKASDMQNGKNVFFSVCTPPLQ
jgi:hypothetical protein